MARRHSFRRRASDVFRFLWERFWGGGEVASWCMLVVGSLVAAAAFSDEIKFDDGSDAESLLLFLFSDSMLLPYSLAARWHASICNSYMVSEL